MVDEADSKSVGVTLVWVRVPPPAPHLEGSQTLDTTGFAGFSLCFELLCTAPLASADLPFTG